MSRIVTSLEEYAQLRREQLIRQYPKSHWMINDVLRDEMFWGAWKNHVRQGFMAGLGVPATFNSNNFAFILVLEEFPVTEKDGMLYYQEARAGG